MDRVDREMQTLQELHPNLHGWLTAGNTVNIFVTGKFGVGKSTLINGVVGKNVAPPGHTLGKGTSVVKGFSFEHQNVCITIWDSPGLQDGDVDDIEYIKDMKKNKCDDADLFLYCTRMDETRLRPDDYEAIGKLTRELGSSIWKNAIFVMTYANRVEGLGIEQTPEQYFEGKLEQWKAALITVVTDAQVDPKIAKNIPIVPAGSPKEPKLPGDRDNWLSHLWCESIKRMKERSQAAFLKANSHRLKLEATKEDFDKPIHEQPIIVPATVKYGAAPALLTVLGMLIGTVAGLPGIAAGGVAGAALGSAADGLIAFFSYNNSESSKDVDSSRDSKAREFSSSSKDVDSSRSNNRSSKVIKD